MHTQRLVKLYLQFLLLHYNLRLQHTLLIILLILTLLIHALLYNTILKNDLKKYETTYNATLMLLILQYNYLQIDI